MSGARNGDEGKTREQLLEELARLRQRVYALEHSDHCSALEQLAFPEGPLGALLEHSPAPICVMSSDDRYLVVNRAWEEYFCLRRQSILGRTLAEVLPEMSAAQGAAINRRVLETGEPQTTEEVTDGPHGRRVLHTVRFPLRAAKGRVLAVAAISMDITELRDAEEAQRQTSRLLHAVIDGITDPVFVKDCAGRYLMTNAAAARLLGKSPAEVIGQSPAALVTAEAAEQIAAGDHRVLVNGDPQTFEEEIAMAGEKRAYLTTKALYRDTSGDVQGILGIARDITEHKQAKGLLEVQRQVLERVSSDAPLAEVLDVLARVIEAQVRDMLCSILLLDEDGVTLRHGAAPSLDADYCRTIDGAKIGPRVGSCGTAAYLGKAVIVEDIATDPLWADYRQLALPHGLRACWSTPIVSFAGKVLGTFAVYYRQPRGPAAYDQRLVEVSTHLAAVAIERKRAQDALRESEGRFQAFMDHSPAVAWMKDEQLRFVYVNRTWEQRFQQSLAQVSGRTDTDFRPTEVGETLRQNDRAVLAAGRSMTLEEMVPDPDGRLRYWQVYKFPFADAAGKRYVGGMAVDISERKEAEARRLAYAERLEALSRRVLEAQEVERRHLARELHDEFGQLLTGINLNLRAIRASLGTEMRPGLEDSISAVSEAIRQTRNFSLDLRPSVLDDFGLGPALRWYVERLSGRAGLNVKLETDLPGGRLPAHVETACFRIAQEALTNVVRHAQARQVHVEARHDGTRVCLSIRDDGVGFVVPPVTRDAAQAEGFGLLGMQDRAQLVGGQLTVESAPGSGTRIRVEIPITPAPARDGLVVEAPPQSS